MLMFPHNLIFLLQTAKKTEIYSDDKMKDD